MPTKLEWSAIFIFMIGTLALFLNFALNNDQIYSEMTKSLYWFCFILFFVQFIVSFVSERHSSTLATIIGGPELFMFKYSAFFVALLTVIVMYMTESYKNNFGNSGVKFGYWFGFLSIISSILILTWGPGLSHFICH